jgi:hypothetical protein
MEPRFDGCGGIERWWFYYDLDGKPCSLMDWARIRVGPDFRIGLTAFKDGHRVSTVWLGTDCRPGDGPPLIFETMVFPKCEHSCRWATRAEAAEGHLLVVRRLALLQRQLLKHGGRRELAIFRRFNPCSG